MADARKDKRTLLSLKIRYKSATLEDFIERYSTDISSGGVFIKAKKPLAVGTLLKFEFMLQDQSTLIHGVGRVVWRRDETEADLRNPAGMGIKFIKMDPESRAVVQRIADERDHPGVFEHGKDGVQPGALASNGANSHGEADRTKVRHVSEFLESALEEGGAGEVATSEARASAERARQASLTIGQRGPARGAFSPPQESASHKKQSVSDAPSRGAMSAFGGSGLSAGARMSSAAPAVEELDADDDFLDNETTKVQELSKSDYPADGDATVIASEVSPFIVEKRQTPVVAASSIAPQPEPPSEPRPSAVSDLFGPDSFGPAPGEVIDASLLDPAVPTVPPPAAASGIPSAAFKVPQAPAAVADAPPAEEKKEKGSRGWLIALVAAVLLVGGGVAAWQQGLLDGVFGMAGANVGSSNDSAPTPAEVKPAPEPVAPVVEEAATAVEGEAGETEEPVEETAAEGTPPTDASDTGLVKIQVTSAPRGAYVSVNGKSVGRAPLELEREVGTKLAIISKARGFLPRRQTLTVKADQAPLKLVLAPLPYVVEVITEPAGAQASAVGGGQTTTPGELRFRSMPGSRTIVVSKDGYKTASKTITRSLFVEEPRQMGAIIKITLVREGAPAAASTPTEASGAQSPSESTPEPAAEPAPAAEPEAPSETPAADAP